MAADWYNIPKEIATKIAEHIEFCEDLETFGGVCSTWRSAAKQAKPRVRVPRLMLPELDESSIQRRFYSLYDHKVRQFNLPIDHLPHEHENKHEHNKGKKLRLLSSQGWLLSVTDEGKSMSLPNPFSGATIKLPKVRFWNHELKDFGEIQEQMLFEKFILSDNPSTSRDFTIALILTEPFPKLCYRKNIITFWRSTSTDGNNYQWNPVLEHEHEHHMDNFIFRFCLDMTFYKGNLYGVDDAGNTLVFEIDTTSGHPRERVVAKVSDKFGLLYPRGYYNCYYDKKRTNYYLVESLDRLMLVVRVQMGVDRRCQRTTRFDAYEINVENGELTRVVDLEGATIFLGYNSSSFSTTSSRQDNHNYCVKPNSIYFCDDYSTCYFRPRIDSKVEDMGVFDFIEWRIQPFYNDAPPHYSQFAPYMWLQPPTN